MASGIRGVWTCGKAFRAEWPSPHCDAQLVLVLQFSHCGLQTAGLIVSVTLLDFPSLSISSHNFCFNRTQINRRGFWHGHCVLCRGRVKKKDLVCMTNIIVSWVLLIAVYHCQPEEFILQALISYWDLLALWSLHVLCFFYLTYNPYFKVYLLSTRYSLKFCWLTVYENKACSLFQIWGSRVVIS